MQQSTKEQLLMIAEELLAEPWQGQDDVLVGFSDGYGAYPAVATGTTGQNSSHQEQGQQQTQHSHSGDGHRGKGYKG